jgi:DNA-binding transcriptional LysR family regulator
MDKTIQVFCMWMQKQSISKAARHLNISEAQVLACLQELEKKWSLQLYESSDNFVPTQAAVFLYGKILYYENEFQDNLAQIKKEEPVLGDELRIGYTYDKHTGLLQNACTLLQKQKSGVKIKIVRHREPEVFDLLRHNHLDCAILSSALSCSDAYQMAFLFQEALYVHFSNALFSEKNAKLEEDQLYFLKQIFWNDDSQCEFAPPKLPTKSGYLYARDQKELLELLQNKKGFYCSPQNDALEEGLCAYPLSLQRVPVLSDFYLVSKKENLMPEISLLCSFLKESKHK